MDHTKSVKIEEFLDTLSEKYNKPEAFVYLFDSLEVLHSMQLMNLVGAVHDRYSPELSIIFRNSTPDNISSQSNKVIEELTSNYFVEYIQQDLRYESKEDGEKW